MRAGGRYVTASPCFRDDAPDELHKTWFFKVELIDVFPGALTRVGPKREEAWRMCNTALRVMRDVAGAGDDEMKKADALIKLQPKNPYFQELRGDILLRAGDRIEAGDLVIDGAPAPQGQNSNDPTLGATPGRGGARHAGSARTGAAGGGHGAARHTST